MTVTGHGRSVPSDLGLMSAVALRRMGVRPTVQSPTGLWPGGACCYREAHTLRLRGVCKD